MANYIGNQPLNGEFKRLDSIESQFNNSSTSFGLKYNNVSQTVGDASQLIVSLNGVIQEPLTSYTLSGVTNIVFASPPANGDTCFIILLGGIGGTVTPSDNSVTTAKLTNNSVTSAKIVNNTITADDMDSSDNYAFNNITVATNTLVTDAVNDRIGVGTANPTYPLDVEDTSAGFIKGSFVSTGSAHSTITFDNTGSDAASVRVGSNNNDFYVRTSGSEKMRVTSGGNVGVGSSSPSKKLDILTSGSYDGIQVSNSSTSTAARLQLNNDNSKSLQIDVGSSAQSTYGPYIADTVAIVANSAPLNIGTDTSTHVALYTNLSERMRIDNSGNVGIGSSSPTEKLVVNGAIGSSNQSLGFSSGPHRVAMDIINASKIARIGTITGTATPTGDEGTVTFLVNNSEKMRVDTSGNFGIGTTSPTGTLSIDSTSGTSQSIITTSTNGSSYVNLEIGGINVSPSIKREITFHTNAASASRTERARIDASGNLLVGRTAAWDLNSVNTTGVGFNPLGYSWASRSGGASGYFKRYTNDGDIIELWSSTAKVGTIAVEGGGAVIRNYWDVRSAASIGSGLGGNDGYLQPLNKSGTSDAQIDLGSAANRFKNIYLSGGVYVGGTGSANYLDDYEEGTWTPTFGSNQGGSNSGAVYSEQVGTYTKIGNRVICNFKITTTSKGTIGGSTARIFGWPFNSSATTITGKVAFDNVGVSAVDWRPRGMYGSPLLTLDYKTSASGNYVEALATTFWTDTSSCWGYVSYFIS